jgi:hypothetical protein
VFCKGAKNIGLLATNCNSELENDRKEIFMSRWFGEEPGLVSAAVK